MQENGRKNSVRNRRDRTDIREALLKSALIEFGARGFDGASTRAIARRVEAHQPQIIYHFASKTALWTAAVDYLFEQLRDAVGARIPVGPADADISGVASDFADRIRSFVGFIAEHPELNQIMVHEGTADSARLRWMVETHVKPYFDGLRPVWNLLVSRDIAVPIQFEVVYYMLVGASSLPYVNAPEVLLLTGKSPHSPDWVRAHAEALVAILLPGIGH